MEKSSHEISNEIAEVEKKLRAHLDNLHILEQERLAKQRQILNLRGEMKDLDIVIDRGNHIIDQEKLTVKEYTRDFWHAKNSGI